MPIALYNLSYGELKQLAKLAETVDEFAALNRLDAFEGTEEDLETAAKIYERDGRHGRAQTIRLFKEAT